MGDLKHLQMIIEQEASSLIGYVQHNAAPPLKHTHINIYMHTHTLPDKKKTNESLEIWVGGMRTMKAVKKYHVSSRCTFTTFFDCHVAIFFVVHFVSLSNSICQIRLSLCHLGCEGCEHLLHMMHFGRFHIAYSGFIRLK